MEREEWHIGTAHGCFEIRALEQNTGVFESSTLEQHMGVMCNTLEQHSGVLIK